MTDATPAQPAPPAAAPLAPAPVVPPLPAQPWPPTARCAGRFDPGTFRQTLIVAGVIAALFFGTQVIDDALPAAAAQGAIDVAPGNPISVGGGWQITPLTGWQATPEDSGGGIRLEKGVIVVDVFPESFHSAGDLAQAYLVEVLEKQASQLTSTSVQPVTEGGGQAARFNYQGIFNQSDGSIEGEVTAVVSGGNGVVADAWAPQGGLAEDLSEVHQMVDTIEATQ